MRRTDKASGRTRADRRSAKLRDMEDAALFLHLLGVLVFVAGIVLAGTGFETARRREQPAEIALLLGLTRIGVALVGVGDDPVHEEIAQAAHEHRERPGF